MRALLFEIVIILVYLAEGNQEATWSNNPPKTAKKISYSDLKGISLSVDNLKDEKVIFESSNLPQLPENSTFSYTFRKLYADHRRITVSLDDMIFLVEKELLNETQAIMIWDSLIKNKTAALQQQEDTKFAFLQYFGNLITNGKNFLGHFPIFLIFLSGYIILLFVYIYLGLTFYVKYAYWALNILSVIFLYNFYYLAQIMHSQLQSIIFVSFIYNSLFFIATILGHSALCTMGLQNDVVKWQELFDANFNFPGKAILSIYGIILGYIFAFQCNFFIAHFPFYASILYLAYIIGKKAAPSFTPVFQPLSLFAVSITGFIIFFYIYVSGTDSFLPDAHFVKTVNQIVHIPLFNTETDFRYAGIIVSSLVVLAGFPLYLIVQSLGLGRDYLAGRFSYKKVFEAIKGAQTKPTFSEASSSKSLWLFSYGALTVIAMYLGFKLKVHFIVILAIFGLQSFNGIYAKERGLTNIFFFYTSGFITVNAAFLLGQIEDQFAPQILGDYREGYFFFFCEALIRMTLNYYAFAICSANIMSHEMGKITNFSDIFFFIIRYVSNYLFAIYLIIMAQMEKSVLHSLFYSVSAVVSFSRVLLYSSSKNDPWARLLISLSIYLSGLRICLLARDLIIPFYFGTLLMNFSVFVTYTTFTHGLSIPLSILYFAGLFSHALMIKSPFMMTMVLVNVCGLIATRIAETKDKMLKIFLSLIGVNLLIFAINGLSFDLYYKITEGVLNTIVPEFLSKFWHSMLNEKELVEQVLGENLINYFKEMF